jgi:uncharacterized membrane protein HdeD (DUF308 family)
MPAAVTGRRLRREAAESSALCIVYGIIALVDAFRGGGWWSGVLGGLGIVFGLVILANPLASTLALPVSLAIVLIGGGIATVVAAFRMR